MIQAVDEAVKQKNTEEMGDAMKALENRTIKLKQEMDILAALDELKSMRVRMDPVRKLFETCTGISNVCA
jgi:hypothetical protein